MTPISSCQDMLPGLAELFHHLITVIFSVAESSFRKQLITQLYQCLLLVFLHYAVHIRLILPTSKINISRPPPTIQSTFSIFILSLTPLTAEFSQTLADSARLLHTLKYLRSNSRANLWLIFFTPNGCNTKLILLNLNRSILEVGHNYHRPC